MNYKLKHIFLLASLACGTAWAEDDNSFYFTDAAVMPGGTTDIELCMRNTASDLTCLEAEIQLPEGVSVVCDEEGNPLATLYRNRTAGHEILTNVLENGNLKLLVSSIQGNLIGDAEGPLLSFRVQVAETAPTREVAVETVGESLLVNSKADAYYSVGVTGNVLITDDATSVNEELRIKNEELEGAIYNLAGQRISKKQKGINIVGGRKELKK
jgi:hypothetical protein